MTRPTLHLICQAHIDPVWLWPWRDGFAEVLTTLQSAVDRLAEFSAMKYTCSSAAFYRWVEETDPRLWSLIKGYVAEGRWEIAGGWVVQPDVLLPSEEALCKQGELGQAYFQKAFGKKARTGYLPDSFGHPAGLPSILNHAGMDQFVFQRPAPYERPDLPNLFWWEDENGGRVLTWRLATGYSQSPRNPPESIETFLRQNWQKAMAPGMDVGCYFVGIGNHGGGPTIRQLKILEALEKLEEPNLPHLQYGTLDDFFTAVSTHPNFPSIPVVRGEILHHARGCYAANTRMKRLYRKAEHALLEADLAETIGAGVPEPASKGRPMTGDSHASWWDLSFNQFHDILPGSSVAMAYEETRDHLGKVLHESRTRTHRRFQDLARAQNTLGAPEGVLAAMNVLPWKRPSLLSLDTFVSPHNDTPITHLKGSDGTCYPIQWSRAEANFGPHLMPWKKLTAWLPLPAAGLEHFQMTHGDEAAAPPRPLISPALKSMTDQARFRPVEDRADTWGHGTDRWDLVLGEPRQTAAQTLEDGPLFRRDRRTLSWGKSDIVWDTVTHHPTGVVELVVHVNWQDRFQCLKLELPFPQVPKSFQCRTPGVAVPRELDGKEAFFNPWIMVEQAGRPLVLVSDGSAAYDATPEHLRLTLLRCVPHAQHDPIPWEPIDAGPFLDEGWQTARFFLKALDSHPDAETMDRFAKECLMAPAVMVDNGHPGRP